MSHRLRPETQCATEEAVARQDAGKRASLPTPALGDFSRWAGSAKAGLVAAGAHSGRHDYASLDKRPAAALPSKDRDGG
ncbi:hypothetical protein GCM10009817_27660 [Terrabacter lapilli]|uniref:Uncharacterized protein n=1 Tax=Terrabacter lapilli TaxID=436231 RepID=A0ABN2SDI8_9MICO